MVALPAVCEDCGREGAATDAVDVPEGSTAAQAPGACPRCGGAMRARDGSYDAQGGVLAAFRGLDADDIARLRDRVESFEAPPDRDRLVREVAEISPAAGAAVQALPKSWTTPVVLTLLRTLLELLEPYTTQPNAMTDEDQRSLEADFRNAIVQVIRAQSPPPRKASAAPPPKPPKAPAQRRKRPPKTHGKRKKR